VSERPLPDPSHPLYGPYWAAAAEERLAMQRCDACGYVRWPPEEVCPECLTEGGAWSDLSGSGAVWSVAVYEHAFDPTFADELPYACALVELDEGPRLIGRAPLGTAIGARVEAVFPEVAPGVRLVCFAPAGLADPD
jgi:uncharacterized OB-fold protein